MYTAIFSLTAALVSIIGMMAFTMSSGAASLLLIVGITGGLAIDQILADRRAKRVA